MLQFSSNSGGLNSPKVRNYVVIDHDYNQNIPKNRFLKKRLHTTIPAHYKYNKILRLPHRNPTTSRTFTSIENYENENLVLFYTLKCSHQSH